MLYNLTETSAKIIGAAAAHPARRGGVIIGAIWRGSLVGLAIIVANQ